MSSPRQIIGEREAPQSTNWKAIAMQYGAGEIPESVKNYLAQGRADEMVDVANHRLPVSLGRFRAIGNLVLGEGWSGLEPWGVWSDGDCAVIYLNNVATADNPDHIKSIGEVVFDVRGAVSEKHPKLSVRFHLGASHTDFVFSWPGTARTRIKLPIPSELALTPVLRVGMEINDPKTAYEHAEGAIPDHRRVGVGIESVQVRLCREDQKTSAYARRSDHGGAVGSAEHQRPIVEQIQGVKSNVIAMTMVYNEGNALRRWIRHYGRHVGERNLLIIDDGSDDGSTHDLGLAGRVSIPRKLADDGERADFVSDLQRALLRYYDAVIYTDCDEFLVPDPRRFANLQEYVVQMSVDCVRPVAFNVIQIRHKEPELDQDRPILDQRTYCQFFTPECKPSLSKVAIRYIAGFHHCDRKALLDPALLLVHSKLADFSAASARLALTRSMRWSDRAIQAGWGNHSRADDDVLVASFDFADRLLRSGDPIEPLDPEGLAAAVNAQMEEQGPPYRCRPFTGPLSTVPDWLRGMV